MVCLSKSLAQELQKRRQFSSFQKPDSDWGINVKIDWGEDFPYSPCVQQLVWSVPNRQLLFLKSVRKNFPLFCIDILSNHTYSPVLYIVFINMRDARTFHSVGVRNSLRHVIRQKVSAQNSWLNQLINKCGENMSITVVWISAWFFWINISSWHFRIHSLSNLLVKNQSIGNWLILISDFQNFVDCVECIMVKIDVTE